MIDTFRPTVDWQAFTGDVLLLPVGSTEQHSAHLPVATDSLQIDFFARRVADALNAALLPTLPFSNCLEHSGFRGTFGLTPETLMHVIRDLAEEAERQHFKILIVLNGHGGNFSLIPACRDWNRRDRPLKILLASFSEFCDPAAVDKQAFPRPEFHSGAWETSLMLALYPEHVKTTPGAPLPVDPRDPRPLQQRDLTLFGVGHFNPGGAAGFPAHSSREAGQAIVDSILANLIPWLQDRIARLRKNPRYSGPGGILVRPATPGDLPEINRLKTAAGWNQTETDLAFFLQQFPATVWVAVHNGQVIGSTTAAVYARQMAWIGMVLVDPEFRRQGVGHRLMSTAIEALAGIPRVKLDATPDGKKLYDRMDFQDEYLLHRMIARLVIPRDTPAAGVRPMRPDDLPAVIAADQAAIGAAREALLTSLFQRAPHLAWISTAAPTAFCLGRTGAQFTQIGPVVAPDPNTAQNLVHAALAALGGQPALLDVPDFQADLRETLKTRGFMDQRTLMRMGWKTPPPPGPIPTLFAIAGPEFG